MTSVHLHPPRHRRAIAPLTIVFTGGSASGLAAEVGPRLERSGHRVTLAERPLRVGRGHDVVFLVGAPSAPFLPLVRAGGAAVAVHLDVPAEAPDGAPLRRLHRITERSVIRSADAVVVGSRALRDRVATDFGVAADLIPAGTRVLTHVPADLLEAEGLVPGQFHVASVPTVADRVPVVLDGFHRSCASLPLVLVAEGRQADAVRQLAGGDERVRVLSGIDPRLKDQLAAHALSSLHAGSAGGADRSLVDAMGAGTAVIARDVVVNREIAGTAGLFFRDAVELAARVEEAERYPFRLRDIGELMQVRARSHHDWDAVAERYAALAGRLAARRGSSRATQPSTSRSAVRLPG